MPATLTPEYKAAEAAFRKARDPRDRLACAGRTGVGMLLLVAGALVVAGLSPADPVTATPDELATRGTIHAVASTSGLPGLPSAAMLISASLWRTNAVWAPFRAAIMWPAHATWISLVLMAVYLMWAVPQAGGFNAEVWAGWMNRLVVASYLAWQLTAARCLIAIREAP
jgi:hypothetical protein